MEWRVYNDKSIRKIFVAELRRYMYLRQIGSMSVTNVNIQAISVSRNLHLKRSSNSFYVNKQLNIGFAFEMDF